jgi:hypothetical protein
VSDLANIIRVLQEENCYCGIEHDRSCESNNAATMLEAIDKLPAESPINHLVSDYPIAYSDGWRDAMLAVHALLHPEEGTDE